MLCSLVLPIGALMFHALQLHSRRHQYSAAGKEGKSWASAGEHCFKPPLSEDRIPVSSTLLFLDSFLEVTHRSYRCVTPQGSGTELTKEQVGQTEARSSPTHARDKARDNQTALLVRRTVLPATITMLFFSLKLKDALHLWGT